MSLIEQLGGYDACKSAYDQLINEGKDIITFGRAVFTEQSMRELLLEHRRQYNIYEPDDWIIFENELMVFAMWSRACPDHAYIGYAYAEDGQLEPKSSFRHATDEEIAAERRL